MLQRIRQASIEEKIVTCLYPFISMFRALLALLFRQWTLCILKRVTGRFWTSCLQTSHVLLPLMLNHFIAHSWWAKASSPLQLHSILRVSPPSHNSTKQIRQTASSSGMSSPSSSVFSAKWEWYQLCLYTASIFRKS